MRGYVVDASVAAKWYLPSRDEPLKQQAMAVLQDYASGSIKIVVPDLFWLECANVLLKSVRRGRITAATARQAVDELQSLDFPSMESQALLKQAFEVAAAFDRSVYDAAYVALVAVSHKPLITADERLANATAARFPVRWLGTYGIG